MICYSKNGSLYVNMTNLCTNKCTFCVHPKESGLFNGLTYNGTEPTREEIFQSIFLANPENFNEICFCGYGEPTCRLYDMLSICQAIREKYPNLPIRVNTNGHSSLILKEDTAQLFSGLVDTVSISLNAPDAETYMKLCNPQFGENTFSGVLKFARDIVKVVPEVVLTVVQGTISRDDTERCRQIAEEIGASFRVRELL